MMGVWDAAASAGQYANNLHLAQSDKHTNTHHSIFTGQMLFLTSNQQYHSTEGTNSKSIKYLIMVCCKFCYSTFTFVYMHTR